MAVPVDAPRVGGRGFKSTWCRVGVVLIVGHVFATCCGFGRHLRCQDVLREIQNAIQRILLRNARVVVLVSPWGWVTLARAAANEQTMKFLSGCGSLPPLVLEYDDPQNPSWEKLVLITPARHLPLNVSLAHV